jgi:hypothetical protein
MEFFLNGLNPFKIQTKFKCSLFPKILIQILFWIWTSSHKESCYFYIYLPLGQFWKFLENKKCNVCVLQAWSSLISEKNFSRIFTGLAHLHSVAHTGFEPAQAIGIALKR